MRYPAAPGRIGLRERLVIPSVILRRSFFVNHAAGDGSVGVDAAIAQEGPIAANLFQMAQVNLAKQDFFFVMRCFCQHSTERIAEERSSPELESLAGSRIAADVAGLKAHSVHDTDIHPIGNRMRALNGAPGIVLCNAKLGLLRGMPPNGSWIEENGRSLQRGESCAFGIPLIPTHQGAEPSRRGIEGFESEIAGSEIKLFVVDR